MIYKKLIISVFIIIGVIFTFRYEDVFAYNSYTNGQKIKFRSSNYYVIGDSDENSDYVFLLREKAFDNNELLLYTNGENIQVKNVQYDEDTSVPYYQSDSCYLSLEYGQESNLTDCKNNYDVSNVKKILENWKNVVFQENELKNVNGYEVKILSLDELINNFYLEEKPDACGNNRFSATDRTPDFIKNVGNFWLMTPTDNVNEVYIFGYEKVFYDEVYKIRNILPAVYLKKCAIEGNCNNENYNNYSIGDKISFKGENYYVIENSNSGQDYVTLFKENPLSVDDIQKSGSQLYGTSNRILYDKRECTNQYHNNFYYFTSQVRDVIDSWVNENFYDGQLKTINGYKARILDSEDDIFNAQNLDSSLQDILNSVPFRMKNEISYSECGLYKGRAYKVNPIIYLKKCAIEGICITDKKNEYSFGDKVIYKGESYHVLKDSDKYSSSVTLLKDDPLTKEQIDKYFNIFGSSINAYENERGVGSVQYTSKTDNSYIYSNIKNIVDNWAEDMFLSSKTYNGNYSAKILTTEELVNYLGYTWGGETAGTSTNYSYMKTDYTPLWFYEKYDHDYMWLMTPYDDSNNKIWTTFDGKTIERDSKNEYGIIRPVVNVSKCVLNPDADSCQKCKRVTTKSKNNGYKQYSIGDIVEYNNINYYVISNSDKNTSFIKLLKAEPLSPDEINTYGIDSNGNSIVNNYIYYNQNDIINGNKDGRFMLYEVLNEKATSTCIKDTFNCGIPYYYSNPKYYDYSVAVPNYSYVYNDNIGGMLYYTDEVCYTFNGTNYNSDKDTQFCNKYYDYNYSNVKTVIDNWAKTNLNNSDLYNYNDYKYRLINFQEVNDFKYNINIPQFPNYFVTSDYYFWNMDGRLINYYENDYTGVSPINDYQYEIIYPAVRPIIFLNKCALDGGCFEETINLASCYVKPNPTPDSDPEPQIIPDPTDNPDDPSVIGEYDDNNLIIYDEIIDAPNTSKKISTIVVVISVLIILIGILILAKNYFKSKVLKNINLLFKLKYLNNIKKYM